MVEEATVLVEHDNEHAAGPQGGAADGFVQIFNQCLAFAHVVGRMHRVAVAKIVFCVVCRFYKDKLRTQERTVKALEAILLVCVKPMA